MPIVEVKLYDKRVTEESVPKIIEALTEALAESSGAAREHIQVIVEGVSPKHWGIAGKAAGLSSTGRPPPRTTSAVSRACSSVVRTISFARAKLSSTVGTGATARPSA